jgi:uncharacterized membrane protein YGL010W
MIAIIFQVVLVAQLTGWIGQFIGHGAFEVNDCCITERFSGATQLIICLFFGYMYLSYIE